MLRNRTTEIQFLARAGGASCFESRFIRDALPTVSFGILHFTFYLSQRKNTQASERG